MKKVVYRTGINPRLDEIIRQCEGDRKQAQKQMRATLARHGNELQELMAKATIASRASWKAIREELLAMGIMTADEFDSYNQHITPNLEIVQTELDEGPEGESGGLGGLLNALKNAVSGRSDDSAPTMMRPKSDKKAEA